MSCMVTWKTAKDYGFTYASVPSFSGRKQVSSSQRDLSQGQEKQSEGIQANFGTYTVTSRRKMKARAPPPPIRAIASIPPMKQRSFSESDVIGNQSPEDFKENMLHRKVDLTISLPGGQEKVATVDGSKAVMDLLVDLCSQHHLNPAQHTLEVKSGVSQQPLTLRPNTLIGTLDVQTVTLKEKVAEVKTRKPPPKVPEKSVRLVVNFLSTQKAVVRVSPVVPLRNILPAVCEKCEFRQEHVILLRDAISKEELDMSKSLNDLAIKELYVWSSNLEKSRKLSAGSDTMEREKKGIRGFFRSHKKSSKNEGHVAMMDNDNYEEVFKTRSVSGSRPEGLSTAPSSPSANSRPIALGASLSLSNISGIGDKKRMAPPPPAASSQQLYIEKTTERKTPEQLPAAPKNKEQKQKRRAPAPPTPQMPKEKINDKEENRKSTTGNGRQMPQKPPRGITRSPPQLVIPPPPPYPPPDNDITNPPVFENGAVVTGPTKHVPVPAKREKRLIRGSSVSSEEVLTIDPTSVQETVSLNSYSTWGENTEDSGMVSSPSDIASLDLQNDGINNRDTFWNQEDTMKTNETYTASVRSASCNSNDSWSLPASPSRKDDELLSVKHGDEDIFIAAQFQQTLTELDEDLKDMDDVDNAYSNHNRSLSSSIYEKYSYEYAAVTESDVVLAVPVTIIDEVPDVNMYSPKSPTEKASPEKQYIMQGIKSAHNNIENQTKNKHAVSTDGENVVSRSGTTYSNVTSNYPIAESYATFPKKPEGTLQPSISYRNEFNTSTTYRHGNGRDLGEWKPSPSIEPRIERKPVKEIVDTFCESKQADKNKIKTEIEQPLNLLNNGSKTTEPVKPTFRPQLSYEPKGGLTTFTVVPPKSGVKQYERSVSLSASAIKIDDLGNLISPHSSVNKKDINDSFNNETEGPLLERAKEFWRSNSMDPQAGNSKQQPAKKLSVHSNKPSNHIPENKLTYLASKGVTPQTPINKLSERDNGLPQPKLFHPAAVSEQKMIIIESTSKGKPDLPILKPSYKRTSSQYVASAISKYTEPPNTKSLEMPETKQETKCDNRGLPMAPKPNTRNIPVEEQKVEIRTYNKQETDAEWKKMISNNGQGEDKSPIIEPLSKTNMVNKQSKINAEHRNFNESQSIVGNKPSSKVEQKCENTSNLCLSPPVESQARLASSASSNSFLKAVREKSVKMEQANSLGFSIHPSTPVNIAGKEDRPDSIYSTTTDEPDISGNSDIFGPKAKLRSVVQKPAQKDMSLHSALMGAIQSGQGKEKLKKLQSSPTNEEEKKFAEPENERSALLSAIRDQSGISRLKKVSSPASDELHTIKNIDVSMKEVEMACTEPLSIPPPPLMTPPPPPPLMPPPPPPPPSSSYVISAPKTSPAFTNNSIDVRESLMEAIRSGNGASRLKKVSASLHTL
ncbi:protein cordon-bleu isoform X2 [Ascaphus truei]|uniref:protein cordon-bleu isoform X2 n=1 Tax=Ascaphus truei TaxID=8439 RepID=UPI003F595D48